MLVIDLPAPDLAVGILLAISLIGMTAVGLPVMNLYNLSAVNFTVNI